MDWRSLLKQYLPQLLAWIEGQAEKQMAAPEPQASSPSPTVANNATVAKAVLDWNDPNSKVSQFFTVKECLWLPTWNRMANESDGLNDGIKRQLSILCGVMDDVRNVLGRPINVHCMYRPGPYSKLVGGSETDVHTKGMAIDFDCLPGMTCDQAKTVLLPILEQYGLRMEDNGTGAGWVHLDTHPVVNARYFKA